MFNSNVDDNGTGHYNYWWYEANGTLFNSGSCSFNIINNSTIHSYDGGTTSVYNFINNGSTISFVYDNFGTYMAYDMYLQ